MLNYNNMLKYTERMKRSTIDKISYLKEISVNVHFDYGCADGSTIEFISSIFPDHFFFGFDINPEMIQLAKSKNIHNATFSTNFDELVLKMNSLKNKKTVLILNSIIHEIYSFLPQIEIDEFWNRVFNSGFDYISIRDMCADVRILNQGIDRVSANKIYNKANPYLIKTFEEKYGSIDNMVNQMHFLLKYHYENNWDNELKENYLICDFDEYDRRLNKQQNYRLIYHDNFKIRFLSEMIKKDFDVVFPGNTHVKYILEQKNGK